MTAALLERPVSSRRVSAGIAPDPGAASRLPAWWGAEHWLLDVSTAVHLDRDLCAAHHVAPDTVVAVARGMAAYADYKTGRDCRPTNERLVAVSRLSLSTVQRARRVLKALGYVVELVRGRSMMTRAERIVAWRRGSAHRQVAAVFALCSHRRSASKMSSSRRERGTGYSSAHLHIVDGDTPPGAGVVSTSLTLRTTHLRRRTDNHDEAAPRLAPEKPSRGTGADTAAARRLAEQVGRRLSWLRGVSIRRTMPTLTRFARAGWTPRDVDLALADVLAAAGWRVPPPGKLRQPAAYLAKLLREVDPADRPTAAEAARIELERREAAHGRLLAYGPPCEHGTPAGNVPSPLRGHLACPECRAAAEPAGW